MLLARDGGVRSDDAAPSRSHRSSSRRARRSSRHPPDVAWVQVAVEARGAKPEEARQRAADSMTSVLAALKPIVPAPNLRTSGLSVTPEMDYTTGGSRLKGYLARNQVEARVDNLELLSKVMDAAIAYGRDVDHRSALRRESAGAARARGASQRGAGCDGARPGDRGRRRPDARADRPHSGAAHVEHAVSRHDGRRRRRPRRTAGRRRRSLPAKSRSEPSSC